MWFGWRGEVSSELIVTTGVITPEHGIRENPPQFQRKVSPTMTSNHTSQPLPDSDASTLSKYRSVLSAPIILHASHGLLFVAGIVLTLATIVFWGLSPKDVNVYPATGVSVLLGLVLGFRAERVKRDLNGVWPLKTAFGVAWRIGGAWVILLGVIEYLVTDRTSTITMAKFPEIFVLSGLGVGGAFLVGFLLGVARSMVDSGKCPSIGIILNGLIGIAGLVLGGVQVAGLDRNSGATEESKARVVSGQPIETSPDKLTVGDTIASAFTGASQKLPDGTYYAVWYYDGSPGEKMTISMESKDFDTYLVLGIGELLTDDFEWIAANDDWESLSTNSRIEFELERDTVYTVVANQFEGPVGGQYRIILEPTGAER